MDGQKELGSKMVSGSGPAGRRGGRTGQVNNAGHHCWKNGAMETAWEMGTRKTSGGGGDQEYDIRTGGRTDGSCHRYQNHDLGGEYIRKVVLMGKGPGTENRDGEEAVRQAKNGGREGGNGLVEGAGGVDFRAGGRAGW